MKIVGFLLISFICFCSIQNDILYAEQTTIDIRGEIVNSTQEVGVGEMVSVALHINTLDSEPQTQHTFTDSKSSFLFEDVPYSQDKLYGVSTIYQGAVYVRNISIESGIAKPALLSVYDTSTEDDMIFLSKGSFSVTGIDSLNQKISILELATISNRSKLTYVQGSGPMDLIRFGIPKDATNFVFDTLIPAAEYIQVDKGFALIAAISPGDHEVMYSYDIPYKSQQAEILKTWRYGVQRASILFPHDSVDIRTDFEIKTQETIAGTLYTIYESKNISKGSQTKMVLSGLPTPKFVERISNEFGSMRYEYTGPVGLLLFLVLIGVVGISRTIKSRNRHQSWLIGSNEVQVIEDQIAELDKRYSKTDSGSQEYMDRRAYLVKRLRIISQETEIKENGISN